MSLSLLFFFPRYVSLSFSSSLTLPVSFSLYLSSFALSLSLSLSFSFSCFPYLFFLTIPLSQDQNWRYVHLSQSNIKYLLPPIEQSFSVPFLTAIISRVSSSAHSRRVSAGALVNYSIYFCLCSLRTMMCSSKAWRDI
jgi:hypothetical protein